MYMSIWMWSLYIPTDINHSSDRFTISYCTTSSGGVSRRHCCRHQSAVWDPVVLWWSACRILCNQRQVQTFDARQSSWSHQVCDVTPHPHPPSPLNVLSNVY